MEVLELEFYQGRYTAILQATIDGPSGGWGGEDTPWVVGALSFVGRLVEARAVFDNRRSLMTPQALVAAQCFLAINLARASQYADARRLLMEAARGRHSAPKAGLYCCLGLAFYHSALGDYARAEPFALKALGRAIVGEFPYGKILARDLLAHLYVHAGRMSAALTEFRQAELDAAPLGDGAIVLAIRVSLAVHSARHGFAPQSDLARLEALQAELAFEDSFSAGKIAMELGRQCVLRGQAKRAREHYANAAKIIGCRVLPWFSSRLGVREAHLAWSCGDDDHARAILASAAAGDVEGGASSTKAEFSGLRWQLGLEPRDAGASLAPAVNAVDGRIRRRRGERHLSLHPQGDDPLGDLLDALERDPARAVDAVIRDGFLGLLYRLPGIGRGGRSLHFGLAPARVVIFDRGDVTLAHTGKALLLESLAKVLASGWQRKEDIVRELWGYTYDPARHDSVVYRAVGRLRTLLPDGWVASANGRYRLPAGVEVVSAELRPERAAVKTVTPAATPEKPPPGLALSHRQRRLTHFADLAGVLNVKSASAFLGLSAASARRELAHLVSHDYLSRDGKGRATTYRRPIRPDDNAGRSQ